MTEFERLFNPFERFCVEAEGSSHPGLNRSMHRDTHRKRNSTISLEMNLV